MKSKYARWRVGVPPVNFVLRVVKRLTQQRARRLDDVEAAVRKVCCAVSGNPAHTERAVLASISWYATVRAGVEASDWVFQGQNESAHRRFLENLRYSTSKELYQRAVTECRAEGRQFIADFQAYQRRRAMVFREREERARKACLKLITQIKEHYRENASNHG